VRSTQEAIAVHGSTAVQHLEEYVRDGFVGAALEIQGNIDPVVPPYRGWESSYVSGAMVAGRPQSFFFEKSGVEGILDARLASQAFAASYTGQMIEHYRHEMFPTRFPGRILQRLSMRSVVFTALGVIIGCEWEAHRLARIQLAAFRKGYFGDKCYYPIFNFVLRLLADYLNDQPLVLEGDAIKEPTLNALFDSWRLAEPTALQDIALAVCDFHTHRFKVGKGKNFYEFENGDWTRTPFEILLLFKLRQKLGLRNPKLDHPLMNTALGQLPTEVSFQPDDLIARVRDRMAREGYDEDAIAAAAARA
jgi:hypothetical protein